MRYEYNNLVPILLLSLSSSYPGMGTRLLLILITYRARRYTKIRGASTHLLACHELIAVRRPS